MFTLLTLGHVTKRMQTTACHMVWSSATWAACLSVLYNIHGETLCIHGLKSMDRKGGESMLHGKLFQSYSCGWMVV